MKLELKHITPYLPYGLKLYYEYTNKIGEISNIYTIGEGYDNDDIKISVDYSEAEHIWMFKPILRPLSDLNIFDFGSKTPNKGVASEFNAALHIINHKGKLQVLEYWFMQLLLEHHFDVFGLIEKKLAIDINTLNK